ncbi:hypothetical protein [Plasticicumulans sp.]|uniref:hypothetical protein n=1 Tax=Plasticicumulans sp. TaxID=2307179 RepID=UPI002B966F65|nr:hypothetical protein [Plasticicumulans sp.]MBS0601178.1 hypothetical protein [Pseudomonadota bacterium]HMV38278.1 hypothetical protein [Plasticicumulans sp.]HMW28698.1 hypothetical protein [Plasticicumulans sp.]HMW41677.1 hypothetical protein [Plasticicumulans sp.]HMX53215.1 hypothetical protein [Plasticicumulans sp.]
MKITLTHIPETADIDAVRAFLREHGIDDAGEIVLIEGDGSLPAVAFELEVSAAVAESIAAHLRGKLWDGHVIGAGLLLMSGH